MRPGRKASAAFLLVGCLVIVFWQATSFERRAELDRTYGISGSRGLYPELSQRFFYFLYYTGKFPLSVEPPGLQLQYSTEAAHALLDYAGLVNESYAFVRTGDLGKVFLLYPDAWLRGTPEGVSLHAFNRIFFTVSLLALFVGFSLQQHRLFAIVLVALFGSSPFLLREIYVQNNVHGYQLATAMLVLALCSPLILRRSSGRLLLWIPAISGVFLATTREVRPTPALIVISVAACCVFASGGWRRRAALCALLAASFLGTTAAWSRYWDQQFAEAVRTVEAAGGTPYRGARNRYHSLWHPVWCGLSDFDRKYGHKWSDRAAYRFAIPRVNIRFGTDYRLVPKSYLLWNFEEGNAPYRIKPETLPAYNLVLRETILHQIREDPAWYAEILGRRTVRVFSGATPVRLGIGPHHVDIPFSAWLFLPTLVLLLALREWPQVKLLLFFLPTSLTALLVHSGRGFSYNSAFHLVLFAMISCWVVFGVAARLASSRSAEPGGKVA